MSRDTLPFPPQMRNGGSSPAHLSSSYLSNPSWWLHIKWSQPPPCAPEWLFDYYESNNPPPPDTFGRPIRDEDWLQRAICEDQQGARLLLLVPLAHADRTYRDWKRAIDKMWADEQHCLCLIKEERAARACQEEAACR